MAITLTDLSDPPPDRSPADWNDEGIVHLPELIPGDLIAAYEDAWTAHNGFQRFRPATDDLAPEGGDGAWITGRGNPEGLYVVDADTPGGWPDACPYMRTPALLELCMFGELATELEKLVGEAMGLHLNLTGWTSTRRNWHQDGYLNPAVTGDHYAAVWIALGDVHPSSGVFQYVPGSHLWHRLTFEKVRRYVDVNDPAWPAHTEAILTDLVEAEIDARNAPVVDYAAGAGDVLIWHPRLYHRGSTPLVPNAYRPSLIAHFSGIDHRPDFPMPPVQHPAGGWYWPIITDQPVR